MNRIAQFMKVSRERFEADWQEAFPDLPAPYDALKLPARATAGSAGYDFYAPVAFELRPGQSITLPTGVRARIDDGWALLLFPRSGLGFKYRLQLNNTVGVVDADYFGARNEGHIFIKLTNAGERVLRVGAGEAFAQGLFLPHGITCDDDADGLRTGGFGSTDP
ncbi:MAG: deoxyuridine 5'-triphosphate nucleotidohydrolase [Clostridia bacterium]|nr:deoxyuridine 5'-triphosphate nucleotidohydrolase [Clostridia bacterium]